MDEKNTYTANVYCKNCDLREAIEIQKGKRIEEIMCPKCGTLDLVKNYNVDLDRGNNSYNNWI